MGFLSRLLNEEIRMNKIFAEISIRGIQNGNVFGPITTEVAGLGNTEYDMLTKVISDALYQLGVDIRDQLSGPGPKK